jgi:hypothetical protein
VKGKPHERVGRKDSGLTSNFFIQLAKKDQSGNRVPGPSTFMLEAATVTPPISEALFSNKVVIEFDRDTASDIKFF